ncbi:MAG: Ig-like domain-containing protein, partial [Bacteroidales bacterium]|nr:Ig-like domain-containing protein [Bacteroidales bacterium]
MTRNRLITSVMTAIAVVALGVTALSVNSCKNKETEILVTGVKVSTPTLTINEGETATISFTVEPSNASNKGVSFTSSDTSVVTVDENGVVTAVGPGTATITITTKDGSYTATVTVTVKGKSVAVSGVSLDIVEVTIKEGDSVTLTATVKPDDAADKSVSWSSSDDAVASVADGVVTGVKAGSATITVKTNDGGKTATCAVTVEAKPVAVESVSLDKSELTLEVGDEATLTATVSPADATDKEVSWSSSDPSVATVDEGGKVVAKAPGTTAVTVTTKDGGKSASCAVTVKAKGVAVESVSLDKSELTLVVGEDATLTATVKPDGATDKSVSWASDKEAVATVDESGKVSAKAEGEATITVTTKDGGKTATCKVTVKAAEVKVTGIKLDKSSITIGVGEEITLTPTIEPDDATDKTVTWQSNDASVAAVDETGKVTGKAAGSATIIATTKDGGFKATCSVKVTDAGVSVTGVSLNESEIVMEVGDGAKLWETVTPSTAANKKVTWSSDKPEVADVDDNGNVEAKAV